MSKPINMDQKGRQQISDFRSMRGIDALKPETAPERNKLIVERDESLVAAFAKYSVYKKKGLDAEAEKLRERYQLNDFILYQLTGTGRSSIYDKNVPIADLAGEVKRLEVMLREDDILHVKVFLDEAIDQFWRYLAIERKG